MDSSAVERGVAEPTSWEDVCNINVVPSDLFFKFRKEILGIRVCVNLEFYNAPVNDFHGKLVLKPLAQDRRWKFIYEPLHQDARLLVKKIPVGIGHNLQMNATGWKWKLTRKFIYEPLHQDVRLLSKKIPVTKFLNLQVGIGHNFQMNATGWKWKLTTCLGGDGISRIRNKTTLGLCPGIDFRFGWRADYVLPKITGGLGSEESLFIMNSGKFQASLDRVEAIFTYPDASSYTSGE